MVWIDQPVGTGFSTGTPNATSSEDAAVQFLPFWKRFVDLFELHHRKVFITGESFAGQYVPYIAAAMLDQKDTDYYEVSGIMIYDPSFGWPQVSKQVPMVAFTDAHEQSFAFNETFKAEIHEKSSSCGYDAFLSNGLSFPPSGPLPPPPGLDPDGKTTSGCDLLNTIYAAIVELNPCFNIYEIGDLCPIAWDILGNPAYQNVHVGATFEPYLNRTAVKQALHAPLDTEWQLCTDKPVLGNFTDRSAPAGLSGGPLQRVVEATNNVVVAHGTLDMILLSAGSLLTLQNLTWNGGRGFSAPPTQPFRVPRAADPAAAAAAGAGVLGGWVSERGMTFCTVELSGHEVPAYQPAAAFRQLEFLLGRVASLGVDDAFTTEAAAGKTEMLEADCY
ncbi:Carboxypeptidase cpdS [Diplodia seriata]|uniref:Carboxypeptidase cpdS n=1 Tax=Diplodia seriata TaxID=420778 RepID=A0A1S8BA84_9PEZI|nr:Carboxypeptidase cpdS [Diplodia seriata]